MKRFNQIVILFLVLMASLFLLTNLYLHRESPSGSRPYRVDIERAAKVLETTPLEELSLADYPSLLSITKASSNEMDDDFISGRSCDYQLRLIHGIYYRFDYNLQKDKGDQWVFYFANALLLLITVAITVLLIFIRYRILKPFYELREVPYELSKGNLTVPLKESKNRFFGKFVWGMDLLRENLEQKRMRELALQKDKKTLILSISHDIKTPLSAIKLYAGALEKNLYPDPEQQKEVASSISVKANEIEYYVSEIIRASKEDFLDLEVHNTDFYLSAVVDKLSLYYKEKLALHKTEYQLLPYQDCLLYGDCDRYIEVLQNLFENALKYGDGRSITLSFADEEDCRLITVTNSGCTLNPNELPHIFDSFYRGSNANAAGGSGLGLYISRQLMMKMKGDIFAAIEDGNMAVTLVAKRSGN